MPFMDGCPRLCHPKKVIHCQSGSSLNREWDFKICVKHTFKFEMPLSACRDTSCRFVEDCFDSTGTIITYCISPAVNVQDKHSDEEYLILTQSVIRKFIPIG